MAGVKATPRRACPLVIEKGDYTDAQIWAAKKQFGALFKGPQLRPQVLIVSPKTKSMIREHLKKEGVDV